MSLFPESAPDAEGFFPGRLERLGEVLRADAEAAAIPGAVALVARNGRIVFHEAYGFADRGLGRPMQRDAVFRIASMTKPLTAVAALMLMERGKLLLSDPVARYLPALRDVRVGVETPGADGAPRNLVLEPARRAMTLHDLARHTAGFTYGQFGDSLVQRAYRGARMIDHGQSNADMVAKLAELPLAYQPGTTFEYGMSTDVLGHVVEIVSGMALDEFFREHLTGPLGMPDTAFGIAPQSLSRLAEPHREPRSGLPAGAAQAGAAYDPARPSGWLSGGGGLLSTASDYARFAQMLLNEGELDGVRVLSRKSVQLMVRNHLPATLAYGPQTPELGIAAPLPGHGSGYGLGIGVRVDAGLAPVPGSPGDFYWGGAFGPYFWADPAERLLAVFMLQELNVQVRTRYRALMRALVYQALR